MFVEFVTKAGCDVRDGQARGVGRCNRPGLAMLQDALQQGSLDIEILGNDLDNPIATADQGQIIVEVAERDQARGIRSVKSCWLRLFQAVHCPEDELISGCWRCISSGSGRHDIEEDDWNSSVGDVGSDAGAHGSGAEDGDFRDLAVRWQGLPPVVCSLLNGRSVSQEGGAGKAESSPIR